jgi:hypothetical protein
VYAWRRRPSLVDAAGAWCGARRWCGLRDAPVQRVGHRGGDGGHGASARQDAANGGGARRQPWALLSGGDHVKGVCR